MTEQLWLAAEYLLTMQHCNCTQELDYYILNSQSIAQLSALLVGLSWSALLETSGGKGVVDLNGDLVDDAGRPIEHVLLWSMEGNAAWHAWAEFAYPILVTINACLCTCTLWGCTARRVRTRRQNHHKCGGGVSQHRRDGA